MAFDISYLKKKELGLPLYAWALLLALVGFYFYRRRKATASTATNATPDAASTASDLNSALPTSAGSADSGGGGGFSGGGTPTSDITNPNPFDNTSPYYVVAGGVNDNSIPASNTSGDQLGSTPPVKAATLQSGGLNWGGQIFGSQTAFNSWLTDHGGNLNDFARNHPTAFKQLQTLPAGGHPSESVNNNPASSSKSQSVKVDIPQSVSGSFKIPSGSPLASTKVKAPSKVVKVAPPSGYDPKSKSNLH